MVDMRLLATIAILFFLGSCTQPAQQQEEQPVQEETVAYNADDVKKAVNDYNAAMMAKDTVALNNLLHDQLSYGHSNGWIETKTLQKEDLYNGTITYNKIDQSEPEVIMDNGVATVRGNVIFDVDYKGTEHMMFDLHVMQTWVYEDGRWQMLNRQSVANKKEN